MPRTTDTRNPVPPWELENPICPHNSPAMNLSYGRITDTYFLMFHSFYTYSNLQLFLEGYIFKKKKKGSFFLDALLMFTDWKLLLTSSAH